MIIQFGEIIKLNNNYVLLNNFKETHKQSIDVKNVNWKYIKSNKNLFLEIDFNTMKKNEYKFILRKLFKLKKRASRHRISMGLKDTKEQNIIIGNVLNFDGNDKEQQDFINGINAILHNTLYDMYNYIYSIVCDYLDYCFIERNLCEFKNDKCIEKRGTSSFEGCCHTFKNRFWGAIAIKNNFVVCKYLKNKTCSIQCISCKLFTCSSLRKKGVNFKISDILLLDTFFGVFQKYIIKTSVFTSKEVILKKLLWVNKRI